MRLFAYLDPGSAGVMLQALLGGAAAALVSIKMFGKRVFRTLMFWKKDDEEPKASTSTSAATQHDATRTAAQDETTRTAAEHDTRTAAEHETEKEPV